MIVWDGGWLSCYCCCCFFLRGGNCCLPQHRRDGFSLITSGYGETLCYKELSQMGSTIFQWGFNSEACLKIQSWDFIEGSFVRVCLVVLNKGCCGSGQYNLPDRMLRLDANTTLNQSYVLFITLVNITYQSRDQYLPSIHSWDSSPWQVLYIPLFCFLCVCF